MHDYCLKGRHRQNGSLVSQNKFSLPPILQNYVISYNNTVVTRTSHFWACAVVLLTTLFMQYHYDEHLCGAGGRAGGCNLARRGHSITRYCPWGGAQLLLVNAHAKRRHIVYVSLWSSCLSIIFNFSPTAKGFHMQVLQAAPMICWTNKCIPLAQNVAVAVAASVTDASICIQSNRNRNQCTPCIFHRSFHIATLKIICIPAGSLKFAFTVCLPRRHHLSLVHPWIYKRMHSLNMPSHDKM